MPLGIYVFNNLNEDQMEMAIGIVLIIAVIFIIVGKQTNILENWFKKRNFSESTIFPVSVGFIAGVLGGAVAIPGPPMILYGTFMTSLGFWDGEEMKSIFTAFFGTLMLYKTIMTFIGGNIDLGILVEALISIPGMLLGAFIGIKIFDKISNKVFNWIIIVMLVINAVILLI